MSWKDRYVELVDYIELANEIAKTQLAGKMPIATMVFEKLLEEARKIEARNPVSTDVDDEPTRHN